MNEKVQKHFEKMMGMYSDGYVLTSFMLLSYITIFIVDCLQQLWVSQSLHVTQQSCVTIYSGCVIMDVIVGRR